MTPVVEAMDGEAVEGDGSGDADADTRRAQIIEQLRGEIDVEQHGNEEEWIMMEWEAKVRNEQLKISQQVLTDKKRAFADYCVAAKERVNWIQYTACDGLPDPNSLSDMNTYMYLWTMEDERCDMNALSSKTETVLYLLARLNEIISHSSRGSANDLIEYKKIRERFRKKLEEWMDIATYRLLRRIESSMTREDMRNARYVKQTSDWTCCVWALIPLPLSMGRLNPKERKSIEIDFEDIQVTVELPPDVDCYRTAIRALWLNYDHYSDSSASFEMPDLPDRLKGEKDLLSRVQQEYEMHLKIRKDQSEERKVRLAGKMAILEKLENPPPSVSVADGGADRRKGKNSGKGDKLKKGKTVKKDKKKAALKKVEAERETEALAALRSIPYLATPHHIILLEAENARKERQRMLLVQCEETLINLRKYRILAGTVHIDLLHQPPQPKDMRKNILLTTLQVPKELRRVPFSRVYAGPPAADAADRTPEVIEAELKALEAAMEALAFITIKLPERVLWSEPPVVAHWIEERRVWSTADVHDVKFNEEKQTIAFRSGRLGVHGLAAYKYSHLPYQGWELKPEIHRTKGDDQGSNTVLLNITTATLQLEFMVREDLVCLNALLPANSSSAFREIIGQFTKLHILLERMREAGCDVFPERDAYSYVKALVEKEPAMVGHLRHCIGLLCTAYSFSWSRWNSSRPPREVVLQYKELRGCVAKQRTNMTLLVTPLRTLSVDCTEVSPEFSDAPLGEAGTAGTADPDGKQFYADLYNMALHNAGVKTRMLMRQVSFKLALTVAKLLESTNVIGMSS